MSELQGPSAPSSCEPPLVSDYADDPSMVELIRFFVLELRAAVETVAEFASEGGREDMRRFAHQIKGAAGGYGFPEITRCAGDLEFLLVSDAAIADVIEAFEGLAAMCRRAVVPETPDGR